MAKAYDMVVQVGVQVPSWFIFCEKIWQMTLIANTYRVGLDYAFGICVFPFFWHAFVSLRLLFIYCSMNSNRKVWLFYIFFSQSVHIVHGSWTHKFHFSATFSLKMGHTVLFTHLKIILLQYFSVFNFSFQFSAVSKWTHNLTH